MEVPKVWSQTWTCLKPSMNHVIFRRWSLRARKGGPQECSQLLEHVSSDLHTKKTCSLSTQPLTSEVFLQQHKKKKLFFLCPKKAGKRTPEISLRLATSCATKTNEQYPPKSNIKQLFSLKSLRGGPPNETAGTARSPAGPYVPATGMVAKRAERLCSLSAF